MKGYSLATFGLCALTSALVFGANQAQAQVTWRTMSPFYCSVYNRDQQWGLTSPYDYTVANQSATTDMAIACGVPDDSDLRHNQTDGGNCTGVTIVGHATGSGIANACACVSYSSQPGGNCGNSTNITTTGMYTTSLDTKSGAGSWVNTSDTDMPYIYMVLKPCTPSASCTAFNTLRGYKVTAP